MTTVDLYLRISRDTSPGQKTAVPAHDRQEKACRKLARSLGLEVRLVHVDVESASDPAVVRPGFEALLAARPEAVVCWHQDRLIRTTRDLERVIALGVNVHSVEAGRLDLSTPTGRAVARTVVAWSQFEVEHKSARQRAANLQRAEAGRAWVSGTRTFGFERDGVTPHPTEAERVREAYRDVLAGVPARAILRAWAAEGVLSTTGGPWGMRSFRGMLERPCYAGRRIHRGVDVGPLRDAEGEPVAPIVDPDTWAAVQVLLADPSRNTNPRAGRGPSWLLSGIALCGRCRAPLLSGQGRTGDRTSKRYRTLQCGSRHLARAAEPIEALVVDVVLERLRRPDAAALFETPRPDVGPLRARAGELRAQREALAADLTIALDFAASRDRRLRAELAKVEAAIAEASRGTALEAFATGRDPAEVWEGLDLARRRAVVREVVEVEVLPVRRGRLPFDPASVRISQRGRPGPRP